MNRSKPDKNQRRDLKDLKHNVRESVKKVLGQRARGAIEPTEEELKAQRTEEEERKQRREEYLAAHEATRQELARGLRKLYGLPRYELERRVAARWPKLRGRFQSSKPRSPKAARALSSACLRSLLAIGRPTLLPSR